MSDRQRQMQNNKIHGRPEIKTSKRLDAEAQNFVPSPAPDGNVRRTNSTLNPSLSDRAPNSDLFKASNELSEEAVGNQASNSDLFETPIRTTTYKGKGKAPASEPEPTAALTLDPSFTQSALTNHPTYPSPSTAGPPHAPLSSSTTNQIKEDEIIALRVKIVDTEAETARLSRVLESKKETLQNLKDELLVKLKGKDNAFKKKMKAVGKVVERKKKARDGAGEKK